MGFFSDLKEDLSQAVNELMPEEGIQTEDVIRDTEETAPEIEMAAEEESILNNFELDKLLENVDSIDLAAAEEGDSQEEPDSAKTLEDSEIETTVDEEESDGEADKEDEQKMTEEEVSEAMGVMQEAETGELMTNEAEEDDEESEELDEILIAMEQEENRIDKGAEKTMETTTVNRNISDETAVITQAMIITGDIISEGSVDLIGSVNGNIDILGKLNITGSIQGNSKASEIYADNAKINGEISSDGSVKIGQSSVVIGNITATSAVIAGAVKGDIDVQGPVILDTSAIVMGNIKSKSVQINNGAVIEGMCSQCYAEVNPLSFFDDIKKGNK